MTYQTELQRLAEAKASMRQSIINKGVEVPESAKIEDYPGYIAQISTAPSSELAKFKSTLDAGTAGTDYPIGTEIPDTYGGESNPLIVAHYLNSTNNSTYGEAEGAILVRKFVEPPTREFGGSVTYSGSSLKTFLDTIYLENCSDELKTMISDINVPSNNSSLLCKWFAPSITETSGSGGSITMTEGIRWDYYTSQANRVGKSSTGQSLSYWLRTAYDNRYVACVRYDGISGGGGQTPTSSSYAAIRPACFIAKGGN